MTQAITIAIGMEIPWTTPVTISVFRKALGMPGSLNAASQEAKLYPRHCRRLALQARHEQKINRRQTPRKANRTENDRQTRRLPAQAKTTNENDSDGKRAEFIGESMVH